MAHDPLAAVPDEGVPLPQKPVYADAHFDMTAMIDLVFMMNIFFLVTSLAQSSGEVDLPKATMVKGADPEKAIIVTLMTPEGTKPAAAFLGEGRTPLGEGKELEKQIREAIEMGMIENKSILMIHAERGVLHRDVARIARLAALFEGLQLNLAVLEYDE